MSGLARQVEASPLLWLFGPTGDGELYRMDLMFWVHTGLAMVTPIVVFTHARHLFDSAGAALAAALIIALLPMDLRFSRSEVAFIPSIALSSLTFACIYSCIKERSRIIAGAALVVFVILASSTFTVRPLNIIFLPLFLVTMIWLADGDTSAIRKWVVGGVLLIVGVAVIKNTLMVNYAQDLSDGTAWATLEDGFLGLFEVGTNTLINPTITPIGIGSGR